MSLLTRVATLSRSSQFLSRRLSTIIAAQTTAASETSANPEAATNPVIRSHHAVISLSGRDKAGIVSAVSTAITQHEANVEDSRMAILGGDFAMILYVSMKDTVDADRLAGKLRSELPNFSISLRETTAPSDPEETPQNIFALSLEGPDHPGIVSAVSEALAVHGSNVREMDTQTTTAPFAGYELFKVTGKVSVDEDRLDELSSALDVIEERFGSTISLVRESEK